ncbi:hypothetical protein B0T10DRAFT_564837 [Thelonectria olida]|uniref:Uncharacterized protein n=1 Tax=Thelonectria olida TaxID=1576542 RepID=A0A9P9AM56_9HYPO|nr:hypothetical protein B0T10DRAFT_564837 [Thelonectria olida]
MTRLFALSLAFSLLATAVQGANVLFGAYATGQCEECLDQTFESCPGDYETRPYAECMCAGDGGANFVSCLSQCDVSLDEPAIASSQFYYYCVQFFKEVCPSAEQYLDSQDFNEQCSDDAIAAGGIGASGTIASEDPTATAEPTETTGKTEATGKTETTGKTEPSETTETSEKTTQSSSGATASAAPALAVMAGLGLQLINMNL